MIIVSKDRVVDRCNRAACEPSCGFEHATQSCIVDAPRRSVCIIRVCRNNILCFCIECRTFS